MAIHDGTNVYLNEYSTYFPLRFLGQFTAEINGSHVELRYTPEIHNNDYLNRLTIQKELCPKLTFYAIINTSCLYLMRCMAATDLKENFKNQLKEIDEKILQIQEELNKAKEYKTSR